MIVFSISRYNLAPLSILFFFVYITTSFLVWTLFCLLRAWVRSAFSITKQKRTALSNHFPLSSTINQGYVLRYQIRQPMSHQTTSSHVILYAHTFAARRRLEKAFGTNTNPGYICRQITAPSLSPPSLGSFSRIKWIEREDWCDLWCSWDHRYLVDPSSLDRWAASVWLISTIILSMRRDGNRYSSVLAIKL